MKVSVTDEFLWDVYNFLEKTGDVISFLFNPYPRMDHFLPQLKNPIFKKYKNDRNKKKFSNLVSYLKSSGYIKVKNLEGKKTVMITKEGLGKALRASFKIENKKKREDGKWIMVIFDIPEKYKKSRDLLRSILHNLGYKIFQKSVWVCPYDVLEKTEKLMQLYNLENYVKIFLVEKID